MEISSYLEMPASMAQDGCFTDYACHYFWLLKIHYKLNCEPVSGLAILPRVWAGGIKRQPQMRCSSYGL